MTHASIVVNNYNYARFLPAAIDSALAQTHPHTEVVVVDDGSTDDSRALVAAYGDRVVPVLKDNGGQASAFNAGFAACTGEVVHFLDADDLIDPGAIEAAVESYERIRYAKLHWPLRKIDADGRALGGLDPEASLPEGDLRGLVAQLGPGAHATPPTSGNVYGRWFLTEALPMPEEYSLNADAYLFELAALHSPVARLENPHGAYRIHGQSGFTARSFDERLARMLQCNERLEEALADKCQELGVHADRTRWHEGNWYVRLLSLVNEVKALAPGGEPVIMAEHDQLTLDQTTGLRLLPFLEHEGHSWGPPEGDEQAILEIERMRREGAALFVLAWTSFWWLEHYGGFVEHLRSAYRLVAENERLVAFDLR